MKEIIERLEKATGPSLELDHAIAAAIRPDDGHGVLLYTASLDAAMTLVPEGWGWKGESNLGYGHAFTVGHVGPNKLYDKTEGWGAGATPAIALCIAALHSRSVEPARTLSHKAD